jgi:hypothetical protein
VAAASTQQKPKSTEGLSPKILNESPPTADEQPGDVKKHNEELDHRAERAHEKVSNEDAEKDKVSPKFWSGRGGRHNTGGTAESSKH